MKQHHIGPSPFYFRKALTPPALGQVRVKAMDYQDAERYLRAKEPLFAQLANDDQWDILHDAVLEALEEVGFLPVSRASEAKDFVFWVRHGMQQYGGGYNQAVDSVSRRVAAVVSSMRIHQGWQQNDKDLSWLNASAGGALVKPPKQPRRLVKSLPDQRMVAEFIRQGGLGPLADYLQDMGYDTDENRVRIVVTDLREDLEAWEPVRVDRLKDGDTFTFYQSTHLGGEHTVRNIVREGGMNWTIETDGHTFHSVAGNQSVTRIRAPSDSDMARHLLIYANGHWRTKSLAPSLRGRKALVPPTLVDGKCRPNL